MFRVSMFPEVVLGVVLLLGGSQVGAVTEQEAGVLLAEEGEKGAAIDPNGRQGAATFDPNGLFLADYDYKDSSRPS